MREDSDILQGTNFSAKVSIYRAGYHDVDEYVKHLHALEEVDNAS